MKLFILAPFIVLFPSCSPTSLWPGAAEISETLNRHQRSYVHHATSIVSTGHPPPYHHRTFEIRIGNSKLHATIEGEHAVIINDYPAEWRGHMALVRFDGQIEVPSPFSPEHCDTINTIADGGIGIGGLLIRREYRSILILDIPIYLSDEFPSALHNSAQAAGILLTYLPIKNPVDELNADIKLEFATDAISLKLGNLAMLKQQFDVVRYGGMSFGALQKKLLVTSADIICDLISGAAKLTMAYPIVGENRVVKVVYDPLVVRLPSESA
ncbi:MAG TPA: hypothetical protein VEL47_02570 [Myxococcota bacterium]|nr:hypothetical protein [Myxococcota bacterium]